MKFEEFIEKCQKQPLPSNPMARVKILARELAEGASLKLWSSSITRFSGSKGFGEGKTYITEVKHIRERYRPQRFSEKYFTKFTEDTLDTTSIVPMFRYFQERWEHEDEMPALELLQILQYVDIGTGYFNISEKAFNLLQEANPATIFISYSRKDSSPFALYTLEKLKQAGLDAFLDIDLKVGDEWHGRLQKQIENVDIFVIIIGATTLQSEYVQKEIRWAENKIIYPIWESSFVNKDDKWDSIPEDVAAIMQSTQAIEIPKEHPQHYLTAITQLSNRFGITP